MQLPWNLIQHGAAAQHAERARLRAIELYPLDLTARIEWLHAQADETRAKGAVSLADAIERAIAITRNGEER